MNQSNGQNMDMEMEYTDAQLTSNNLHNDHEHNNNHHHHQQQQPSHLHPPLISSFYQNSHPFPVHPQSLHYPPTATSSGDSSKSGCRSPARTESGESQRSQTRRFAAGHAEMQRSAFISAQDEDDEMNMQQKNKVKASCMEEETASFGMDSSSEAYDVQRQKRPRRFTRDPPN